MRDEKRRNKDDDGVCLPKKKRSDDSPSHVINQSHSSASSKGRSYVPMSERQQFALLRQLETEEITSDKGDPGSVEIVRGDLSRDVEGSTDPREECEGGLHRTASYHYHQSSSRERASTSLSVATHAVGEKSAGKPHGSNTIQGALMRLIKTGDLDTLKQLVREGANVNEQDEHGWTALHEFSARNLSRLVAYLLRHGARPDLADRNGDTALHAAARANHARVLRTLLRHNADPMCKNMRGERPLDLCRDTESSAILNRHIELMHVRASNPPQVKYSSPSTSRLARHHHHPGHGPQHPLSSSSSSSSHVMRQSSVSTVLPGDVVCSNRTANTSDLNSDSDDTCSTPGVSSAPAFSGMMATEVLTGGSSGRSVSPTASQRGFGLEHAPVSAKPLQKKDPYAFEDETDECPDHSASLHPAGLLSKTSSTSTTSATSCTINTTSPTGSIRSRVGAGVTGSAGSALPPHTPLLSSPSTATATTMQTSDASGSDATVSPGPPLRLRFAKEAGQYTLMEQQQQQQNATMNSNNQDISASQSIPSIDSSELMPVAMESDRASGHNSNGIPLAIQAPSSSLGSGIVNGSINATAIGAAGPIPEDAAESESMSIDLGSEDIGTAQKVPPLRIKVASGPSTDTESNAVHTTASSNNGGYQAASESVKANERDSTITASDTRELSKIGIVVSGCGDSMVESIALNTGGTAMDQSDSFVVRESIDCSTGKYKSSDTSESHRVSTSEQMILITTSEPEAEESRNLTSCSQASDDGAMSSSSVAAKGESESGSETGKEISTKDTTHRHRSGRTLRSHTAAQREREEKERHSDTTPIKKRKLRARTDAHSDGGSARSDTGSWTTNDNTMITISGAVRNSNASDDSVSHEFTTETNPATIGSDSLSSSTKDEPVTLVEPRVATSIKLDAVKEERDEDTEGGEQCLQVTTGADIKSSPDTIDRKPSSLKVEFETEHKVDTTDSCKPLISVTSAASSSSSTYVSTSAAASTSSVKPESADANGDRINYLCCPAGPDDNKQHPELLMFENPFEKSAAIQRKLRELINNLVEVHPKAPCGYPDYLLVTRNYLLASRTPTLTKKTAPPQLKPAFAELFNEQEEERYAQALKHQSEREHLRLCAEQAVLRAQTRAALAVANLTKPLSFCSVLAYKDLTYVPPVSKTDQRDEENVRDRFTPRTFIGWLEDIKDTFQQEKKKLLCRQLHEAESLMMVQRLDWESKLRESQLHDYGTDVLREIPHHHVPLIQVPNDFPLFAHDPVHRTSLT